MVLVEEELAGWMIPRLEDGEVATEEVGVVAPMAVAVAAALLKLLLAGLLSEPLLHIGPKRLLQTT